MASVDHVRPLNGVLPSVRVLIWNLAETQCNGSEFRCLNGDYGKERAQLRSLEDAEFSAVVVYSKNLRETDLVDSLERKVVAAH